MHNNQLRTPPADHDAEAALLTALINHPHLTEQLAQELHTDDFYIPTHATIWHTWHQLTAEHGTPPDRVLLNNTLTARGETHAAHTLPNLLTDNPTGDLLAHKHAQIIRDHARLRTAYQAGVQLQQLASTGGIDRLDLILGDALQALEAAATRYGPQPGTTTTWHPRDLEAALTGHEIDPPPSILTRNDSQPLLYTSAVHTLSGEPGSGKTFLALLAAVQQLRAGHTVTMIDFEDRATRVVARLLALGAHPDHIHARFRYIRPHNPLDPAGRRDLEHAATSSSLVILDGVTEAMTLHGLDLSSNPDIARFYTLLPRWIADLGPAVTMIDHVVKDGEKQGRWGIGGQHKLAGIDGAAYLVKAIEPFGRGKKGHARITVAKDRPGYIEEAAIGRTIAELHIDATDPNCLRHELTAPIAAPTDDAGNMRPTRLMERVSRYIEINPGLGKNELADGRISGKTTYLKRAIDRLTQEGWVEVAAGPNRKQIHRIVNPYREDQDTMNTHQDGPRLGPAGNPPMTRPHHPPQ